MANSPSSKVGSKKHCKIAVTTKRPTPRSDPREEGKKEHKCDYCQKSFPRKCHLVIHYRTHTGEKPYKCKSCPSKFSRKDHLVFHTRTHKGENPYECKFCEKSFAFAANWREHTRIHTGGKPYECQFCDYSAQHRSNLIHHERTHTGEKPYKCQLCSYSAIKNGQLKRHESIHARNLGSHGLATIKHISRRKPSAIRTKEYKCPDCPNVYSSSSNLSRHKKIHLDENRYACRFCDYFAIQKRDIAKHEQRDHTERAGMCSKREVGSATTKTLQSSVKQKEVPEFKEQVTTATHQLFSIKPSPRQCRVCEFVGTDADASLHMNIQHKLPVVTLQRL